MLAPVTARVARSPVPARIARQAGAFEQLGWFWGKSFTSGYARAEQTLGTLREELAQVALEQHHELAVLGVRE